MPIYRFRLLPVNSEKLEFFGILQNSDHRRYMEVTENLRRQLRALLDRRGMSPPELAARVGVSPRAVNGWLRGEVKTIQPRHAAKVLEFLGDRAPDNPAPDLREPAPVWRAGGRLLRPATDADLVPVPVINLARASGYQSGAYASPHDFIDETAGDLEPWGAVPRGHLLLRVEGSSMAPRLSHGAVLEVDFTAMPAGGDMVVALLSCVEFPIVKYYHRRKGRVLLKSVNDDGASYLVNLADPGAERIYWMHPVVQIKTEPMRDDPADWSAYD